MKVLQVTPRYAPHTGGVETHVREIATRLVNRGHDLTVFSADAGSDVKTRSVDDGVQVRRFNSVNPGGAFHVAPQLALAVRQADADVVHVHNYHSFPLFFAALGVMDERFVVTTHYHGGSASGVRDALLSLYRPLGRWAVRKADEVIAVSEWEHERLQEDFGVDATVIPNGLDVEQFAEAKPEEHDLPYLLCVGRLEEYKGVQHVIRALPKLPEYELVIAGSGPYHDELKRIARREDVAGRVKFLGYVDDERLPELYVGAEVFVTLSEFEAYGMTVAEAIAAKTPCVVRATAALQDWSTWEEVVSISERAVLDTSAVSTAVTRAANNESQHQTPPTWDNVTDRTMTLYASE